MVVPIHDENPTHRVPVVTWLLIAVNVAVFLASPAAGAPLLHAASPARECAALAYYQQWGAIPVELLRNQPLPETAGPPAGSGSCLLVPAASGKVPALSAVTSLFIHAGWLHLIGNMLFLWVFGNNVEDRFGRSRFLLGYLAAGVIANYGYALTAAGSTTPMVGASGAISAVLGAYLMLFPRAKVLTIIVVIPVWLRAWLLLSLWFVIQAVDASAVGTGVAAAADVGYLAHVIGFVVGVVAGAVLRRRPAPPHHTVWR